MPIGRILPEPRSMSLHARSIARSHVGRVRVINEDRVFDCPECNVWAVADGMGGHAGGDIAAQSVIDRLRTLTTADRATGFTDLLVVLGQAHGDIRQRNERFNIDAGATVVAALLDDDVVHVAWAGDSRAYRLRNGALELLTHDHSLVQELVDAGLLTSDAAERHPQSHVITRALGFGESPRLDTISVRLNAGDRLLLCSDGLSRSLAQGDVDDSELESLAERLVANALVRDGSDNLSFCLIDLPRI